MNQGYAILLQSHLNDPDQIEASLMTSRSSFKFIASLCGVAILFGTFPSVAESTRARSIQTLLDGAGFDSFLETYGDGVFEQLMASSPDISESARSTVREIVGRHFGFGTLRQGISKGFAESYQDAHTRVVLTWMREPLFEKIHRVEVEATVPENIDELIAKSEAADVEALTPARRRLLARIDRVQRSSEFVAAMTTETAIASMMGAASSADHSSDLKIGQYRYGIRQQRAAWLKEFRASNLSTNSIVYKSLSDEELEEYVAFSATPAGRWYGNTLRHSVLFVLRSASLSLGFDLAKLAGQESPRPAKNSGAL